jgi:hypothetical protein
MKVDKKALLSMIKETNKEGDDKEQRNHNHRETISSKIIEVNSYAEAAGIILAHKNGILFESLTSKVANIPKLEMKK